MAEHVSVSTPISGTDKTLTLETGLLAPQSQGAVVASIGGTAALVTANGDKGVRDGIDFFPLTVDVEEKQYAAGKIPGSFFRREGRPTDGAILNCRLIDRPLRPSFAEGYRNETQVVATIIGADQENPHDVIALNGASASLMISGIPFEGPIGAVRVAFTTDGEWIPYPSYEEGEESTFQMVVAGREPESGEIAIMMVEAGGTEAAWDLYEEGAPKVTEEVIAQGLDASKVWIKESIDLQRQLIEQAGVHAPLSFDPQIDYSDEIFAAVEEIGAERLSAAQSIADKGDRSIATDAARDEILAELADRFDGEEKQIKQAIRSVSKKVVRQRLVKEGVRMDGRGPTDLRPVTAQVGVLPTAHGSGLFQRGETQVLSALTLGMPRMDQLLDTIGVETKKRYMHHYNMPPYANGETGRMGGTKRREIGHGLLAERALLPVVPHLEEWPYALRIVSEVLSSNGSTSMGSVCGSSLALMDGGVPIKAPVAGIAMGLVYEDGEYLTLTDILGAEDAFGDMDFKVAGTAEFVTALQLDTKIDGLPAEVLAKALGQAKDARLAILEVMQEAIDAPREDVGPTAPKVISFEIPIDKIGEVIGPKGKVINAIQQETGADIAVDDDGMVGTVSIGSSDRGAVAEAERQIKLILNPPQAEVGQTYKGRVVNITKFGAFVNILPGRDGLVHISKLGGGKRIDKVEDVVDLGDEIDVVVEEIDPNGKVSLKPVGDLAGDGGSSGGGSGSDSGGGRDRAPRERSERSDRGDRDRGDRPSRSESSSSEGSAESSSGGTTEVLSFEDSFDQELRDEFGDLGPAAANPPAGDGGGRGRGGRSGSGGGGGGGRGGERRRRR
jgi:polyribonucleotide nucleotidyltransferase